MDPVFIYIVLVVVGLAKGSFIGAWVWRLRARQLVEDKTAGEEVSAKEYKKLAPLTKTKPLSDRSQCLHCGHQLAWYDLIPLVSWLSTGGKCRYCHKFIGWFEPAIELGVALLFVLSYTFWPQPLIGEEVIRFVLWLAMVVLLAALFVYDLKWFLLPNRAMFPLIALSVLVAALSILGKGDVAGALLSLCGAVAILSGLYFLLWVVSKGAWIGFGDVKLGFALALLLGEWQLAFFALFLANVIGCLIILPGLLTGKVTRSTRIPFGPLLIAGGVIAFLWGHTIIDWYFMTFA